MSSITLDELEQFSLPGNSIVEEKKLYSTLAINKKYNTALVVGRFQPLHRGHIYLLQCALQYAESLIICIGSANIMNKDNPFDLKLREKLLYRVLKREKLETKIKKVYYLSDTPDDDEWLRNAIQKAGNIEVVIGNNDWVNSIFKKAGYPVVEIPLLNRSVYEGKVIRKELRAEGKL